MCVCLSLCMWQSVCLIICLYIFLSLSACLCLSLPLSPLLSLSPLPMCVCVFVCCLCQIQVCTWTEHEYRSMIIPGIGSLHKLWFLQLNSSQMVCLESTLTWWGISPTPWQSNLNIFSWFLFFYCFDLFFSWYIAMSRLGCLWTWHNSSASNKYWVYRCTPPYPERSCLFISSRRAQCPALTLCTILSCLARG